jgi:hypothetical protein
MATGSIGVSRRSRLSRRALRRDRGAAVTGLGREDFRVYDNGVRQDIRNLWLDKDVPLALGVIADVSESQTRWIGAHRADVDRFLDRILRPRDRAFVVEVNRNVILRSELIGSAHGVGHVLAVGVGEPLGEPCPTLGGTSLCGGTALWNAVYAAAHWKLRSLQGSNCFADSFRRRRYGQHAQFESSRGRNAGQRRDRLCHPILEFCDGAVNNAAGRRPLAINRRDRRRCI